MFKNKYFLIIFSLLIWQTAEVAQANEFNRCPISQQTPDETQINYESQTDKATPFVDETRPIKDLGTDIVVNEFFSTPDTLFNFMSLVYNSLDNALVDYKEKHKLEDRAIFLLFKGGNVLRIVANGVLDQVGPEVRKILKKQYDPDFTRSDADFSVYIDSEKLGGLRYSKVFDEVSKLILAELDKIRNEFFAHPKKYFNFMRLKPELAGRELEKYFTELNQLPLVEDKDNEKWFDAKFRQLQLLDARAKKTNECAFMGQFDYRFDLKDDKVVGTPLSTKATWISNTDNRTPEWPLGSDPKKKIKFALVRSKIVFEYIYEKDGETIRKPIGGELIDVSIPHMKDHSIKGFLDAYDQNVAVYTLASQSGDEKITMKSYALKNLTDDLQGILFDSFDRPWKGGPKYKKRINRLFFLFITQMLGTYGTGTKRAKEYVQDVKERILIPLEKIYPLDDNTKDRASEIQKSASEFSETWPEMVVANNFWQALADLVAKRLIPNPETDDLKSFEKLLKAINKNLSILDKINAMSVTKIIPEKLYETDMQKLF